MKNRVTVRKIVNYNQFKNADYEWANNKKKWAKVGCRDGCRRFARQVLVFAERKDLFLNSHYEWRRRHTTEKKKTSHIIRNIIKIMYNTVFAVPCTSFSANDFLFLFLHTQWKKNGITKQQLNKQMIFEEKEWNGLWSKGNRTTAVTANATIITRHIHSVVTNTHTQTLKFCVYF